MKVYFLSPVAKARWLTTDEVASRFRTAFAEVNVNAEAAEAAGVTYLAKYKTLIDAGIGGTDATPIETLEKRWAGARSIVVAIDDEGGQWFQTMARNQDRLELVFGPAMPPRKQRSVAVAAGKALGYEVESVDGD